MGGKPRGPTHYVNTSGGNFSITQPGRPVAARATSCGGGYYEIWGTLNRARCTELWGIYVTNGEAVTMTHAENVLRKENGQLPYLNCEKVLEAAPKSATPSNHKKTHKKK